MMTGANGISWLRNRLPSKTTRAEARAALDEIPPLTARSSFALKAHAAFEVADYDRAISMAQAAQDFADAMEREGFDNDSEEQADD